MTNAFQELKIVKFADPFNTVVSVYRNEMKVIKVAAKPLEILQRPCDGVLEYQEYSSRM